MAEMNIELIEEAIARFIERYSDDESFMQLAEEIRSGRWRKPDLPMCQQQRFDRPLNSDSRFQEPSVHAGL